MKKYKLIKEYPGSPKLGFISSNEGGRMFYFKDHPEFWKEVVEKDYKILSYQSKEKIIAPATNFAIEISKPGYWNIYSVKRLSDGEVFTIGDIVARHETWENITPCYIINFVFKKGELTYNIKQGDLIGNYPFDDQTYKYELKKPLFKTECNVEIINNKMTIEKYEDLVSQTAIFPKEIGLAYCALGLNGEAGEVADKIKKVYRDKTEVDKDAIVKELGDVLWYITALSKELNVSLSEVMQINYDKLTSRKERNKLGGSGDDR